MLRVLALLACVVTATGYFAMVTPVGAQTAPEVTLTRFDCGSGAPPFSPSPRFSDTYAFGDMKIQLVYSCYLIKHGNDYMIWDSGHSMAAGDRAPKVSMVDQLAQLKLKPEQMKYIGISHYHGDHIGQVSSFPYSTLLIGKGDWDIIASGKPYPMVDAKPFAHWINGGGKVQPVLLDHDVFGDGTVLIIGTPGHTPGHTVLLVKLAQTGNVVLSGDLAHFRENYETSGVPTFNVNRAETLASIDRIKQISANLKATVIIQHDPRDLGKLPAFPAAAR
jgi:glyoxylase-like metal-dependent hydrolase (beta-lactamase superfamily II)